jgi:hypothetical protein
MHVYDCRAYDKTADEGEGEGEGEEEAEAEAAPEAEAGMAMSNPLTISITHLYHNPYPTSTSPPQLLLQP